MTRHLEADSLVPILDENRKQSITGTVSAILHVAKKKKKIGNRSCCTFYICCSALEILANPRSYVFVNALEHM